MQRIMNFGAVTERLQARVLLKAINPGAFGAGVYNLVNAGGTLFFSAVDNAHGNELWRSDGTLAGTLLVKDIAPVGGSNPSNFASVSGTLFFVANDGIHGPELWKSDGTAAGTLL